MKTYPITGVCTKAFRRAPSFLSVCLMSLLAANQGEAMMSGRQSDKGQETGPVRPPALCQRAPAAAAGFYDKYPDGGRELWQLRVGALPTANQQDEEHQWSSQQRGDAEEQLRRKAEALRIYQEALHRAGLLEKGEMESLYPAAPLPPAQQQVDLESALQRGLSTRGDTPRAAEEAEDDDEDVAAIRAILERTSRLRGEAGPRVPRVPPADIAHQHRMGGYKDAQGRYAQFE